MENRFDAQQGNFLAVVAGYDGVKPLLVDMDEKYLYVGK
jgi:hypothetical protein